MRPNWFRIAGTSRRAEIADGYAGASEVFTGAGAAPGFGSTCVRTCDSIG
jgi:hypothetical protein